MAEKLIDPSFDKFHLFDEKDGVIKRNDGRAFRPADKNPWYVLATVFGEQVEDAYAFQFDQEIEVKNRRAWNGWACAGLDGDARQKLADKWELDVAELKPWDTKEKAAILKRFRARMEKGAKLPDPSEAVNMSSTAFLKPLGFEKRYFAGGADFVSSHFVGYANFVSSHFAGTVHFGSSHFAGTTDFSSVEMKGRTRFDATEFKTHVPVFHAAELYRDTVFPTAEPASRNYPDILPAGKEEVGGKQYMSATEQKEAYNTLRFFMNQNLKIDQELFFHRREMACKEVTDDKWINRQLIKLYGFFSDYGSSIPKPLAWLSVNFMFGFIWLCAWQIKGYSVEAIFIAGREAAGWSFSNVFAFFRFGNLFYGKEYYDVLPIGLQVLGATQTVCGFVTLFLLGLGIRSRFRLR